ncbi:terminase large subunit [Roseibium sp. Sym1]|uniref:terminase large subunit n=1 Tax=Roseibium sp. Sym1 TaxID=3016006 RepID=UPI0022B4979C|nr:terminase TerL endonuclease subunit [Roseibium sp. Sym1]
MILAAERYLHMLEMAKDPENDFYYSPEHVVDYCDFAERLQHFESGTWELTQKDEDGNPDPSIILEPWQIWVESAIQGFRRRFTGERLVTTAIEVIPRKSAKSLKATIAALFDLCCSGQVAPQIPIAAASAKQADDTLFGDIKAMVENDEDLAAEYGLETTKDEVRCGSGTIFKLTSLGERQDGLNPSLALFEEGHAGAASVYKVVDSAFGARPNALRRMITTAGYRPEGPGYELLLDATRVLEGTEEDYSLFAAIYTLDKEDYLDPDTSAILWEKLFTDEDLLIKANPMYGISLDPIKIKTSLKVAKRRLDLRGEAARTRFNIWTGSGTSLIDLSNWQSCKRDICLEDFIGQKCWIGVDLAQKTDMCSIALVFELPGDRIAVFAKYFLPEDSETVSHPELFDQIEIWREGGWLELTEGPLADHDRVREEVEAYCEVFDVQVIACDPAQAHNTVKQLWDGHKPVMVYPNRADTMTPPTDDVLGRIIAKTIWHDGNPVLAWNAQNVYGERKGNGSIMPRKEKDHSPRKIDGFVALCFANGCRLEPDFAKDPSKDDAGKDDPYLTRGILGYEERHV